jgi:3-oxoacyl-[acyl-carrier-protein] synthase II
VNSRNGTERRRVAVTGMGVVSPIGIGTPAFLEALLEGRSGVGPITLFDPEALPTRIAAQVSWEDPGFRDRKISFALEAARQALRDADASGGPVGRGGVSLGIGLELFSMDDLAERRRPGFVVRESRRERMTFLQTPSDLCVHLLSRELGLVEPPLTHVSACAAGTDAIGAAFRMVATGRRDWMLAGGTDSMINPLGVAGFCSLGATSRRNDRPTEASRPFDRRRDWFVLGEGAALLVLEDYDAAVERGARIRGTVLGYGSSFDAYAISEPDPEGRGAFAAMSAALLEANRTPDDVDCVNAHGTSTPKNDPVETLALKRLLGSRARSVPVCATKSMIGHLISAAGAVEAVAALACMERGVVHPTINLEEPDPACDLDFVPGAAREHVQRIVLSNSFGFGGQNASIVLGAADA